MTALAGLLRAKGHEVRGSDGALYPPTSDVLAGMKTEVYDGFAPSNLDWNPDVVVVGNVCSESHPEVQAAKERGLRLASMPETLAKELLTDKQSFVVTGTHGKTTTSSLLAHILVEAKRDPSWFVGGVPVSGGFGFHLGKGNEFVIEGDEYDSAFFGKESKFLHYRPKAAVLTSAELDHLDIFANLDAVLAAFRKFVGLIPPEGYLLVQQGETEVGIAKSANCTVETYEVLKGDQSPTSDGASWQATKLEYLPNGRSQFEIWHHGELFGNFESVLGGDYNAGNVVAAVALGHRAGVSAAELEEAVFSFAGVRRRQEIRGVAQGVFVIDDYAHHPTSVCLTLQGLRHKFPGRRLIALFEPRSASSRRRAFENDYAEALSNADVVIVGKPYGSAKGDDVFLSKEVAVAVHQSGARATAIDNIDETVSYVKDMARPGDVVVVMSSGAFGGIHGKLLVALGDAVTRATAADAEQLHELLKALDLKWQSVVDNPANFLILNNEDGFAGCVCLEVFRREAVLRSLAVKKESRGIGYGWLLADRAIDVAKRRGVRRVYIATESASDFFAAKLGFRVVDQSTISEQVLQSKAFRDRSSSEVTMRLDL